MKTIKYFLLLSIMLSGALALISQSAEGTVHMHTIYVNDGSTWKGEIINWTPEVTTIRLLSGVEMPISANVIRRVVSVETSVEPVREYVFKDRGVYHVSTTGASVGPSLGLSVTHAAGYRFTTAFSIGGGIGIESFDLGSGIQIVPVFTEVRGFLMKKSFSPYYAARIGHGSTLVNSETNVTESKGGVMYHVEFGYRFGGKRPVSYFAGLAMHWQRAQYLYDWQWETFFYDRVTHRRTELRFGVIF
jgi:hypothetical protein